MSVEEPKPAQQSIPGLPTPRGTWDGENELARAGHAKAVAEIKSVFDADGAPNAGYHQFMASMAYRQATAAESTRKMMLFFTVLGAVGLVAGLIIVFLSVRPS